MNLHRSSILAFSLTSLALLAFASNSILCRLALGTGEADAGAFTAVRLISGAIVLAGIVGFRDRRIPRFEGSWFSAAALFAYAFPFSLAYLRLPAGTGALLLFGAVQATMFGWEVFRGRSPHAGEWIGLALAIGGLLVLTSPGLTAPDLPGSALMVLAGVSWGVYSLRGRQSGDPLAVTAGNFFLSLPFILPMVAGPFDVWHMPFRGVVLAVLSGAVASGAGYAVWYAALRSLAPTRAAIVQLLVPVLAALGGVAILNETVSLRLLISGCVIFAGVTIGVFGKKRSGS